MKYAYKKVCINAPFPTTQAGHACQTYEVTEFKDDLYARIMAFKTDECHLIHVSCDLLDVEYEQRLELQRRVREALGDENIHVVTSATHTHYAHSPKNKKYMELFTSLVTEAIVTMEYEEKENVTVSYQKLHTTKAGKSRISGYETDLEFLTLTRLYSNEDNFLNIVTMNAHPTTLIGSSKFFSAEYPGELMRLAEKDFPNANFTFMTGAAGDISSRFVRNGQNYEDMITVANNLYGDLKTLMQEKANRVPFRCSYVEVPFEVEHDFTPVDLSKIRSDLAPREMETIRIGQEVRQKLDETKNVVRKGFVGRVDFGAIKFVFFPNEIFTYYMSFLNLDEKMLVSYSNGYAPYVLPIGFEHVTYEMFTDTMSVKTKKQIIDIMKNI